MATNKPKLQGYIERSLFDHFQAERQTWGLTQSQALDRVLAERYTNKPALEEAESQVDSQDRFKRLEDKVCKLGDAFNELSQDIKFRLWLVELKLGINTQSELPQITSDTESELPQITSDIESELPQITNDTQGNSLQITSDTESELPQITNDTQGDSLQITSDIKSDSLQITSDIQDELPQITSDIQGDSISTSHPYFDRLLVCELRKDGLVDYWGEDGRLTVDIRQAKLYEHKRYAEAQLRKLQVGLSPIAAGNIKIATARTRLEAEIGLNKIPYSLRQIFDYWEKQEIRRINRRKSKGHKDKSVIPV